MILAGRKNYLLLLFIIIKRKKEKSCIEMKIKEIFRGNEMGKRKFNIIEGEDSKKYLRQGKRRDNFSGDINNKC